MQDWHSFGVPGFGSVAARITGSSVRPRTSRHNPFFPGTVYPYVPVLRDRGPLFVGISGRAGCK